MEESRIREVVQDLLIDHPNLFLVDVKVKGNVGNQKVLVFIDGDEGISIDQCSKISRELGSYLEEHALFEGKYTMEVSSPGLDHPLTLPRQYAKHQGRTLDIETHEGMIINGVLEGTSAHKITLKTAKELMEINFEEIKHSFVKVSFK